MSNTSGAALAKSFGFRMAVIIVMSSIIGSGVFKKVAPMSEVLHQPWLVVLAWICAGIIILFGVFCIAELGAMFPHSGGAYVWFEASYGKAVAFLYGWSCFTVIQTAAISSIAFVFAGALDTFISLPKLPADIAHISILGLHPLRNFGAKLVSCLLIIILSAVNIKGAKKGGNISLVFTFIITIAIIAIIIAGFSGQEGSLQTFETVSRSMPVKGFTVIGFTGAMVIAMRHAFWGYEGWIALGFIGEEIHNPKRNLPRALITGIVIIILLYAALNAAYLYVMPVDEMLLATQIDENKIAAVLVMDKLLGSSGAYVISGMILISTFGCTNATILVSSRIYYAMARGGMFFKKVAQQHPKSHTPYQSLIFQCVWACILVFSGSFDMLTDLLIIAAFVFYGLVAGSVLILRKKQRDLPRPYKTYGYPIVPVIFIAFCLLLLVISFYESPLKSLVGAGLILSGLPFYYYWKRKALARTGPSYRPSSE